MTNDPGDVVVWSLGKVRHACRLDTLAEFEDTDLFGKGVSLRETFPGNAYFTMNQDFPNDTLLTDTLRNYYQLIIVSERQKTFLEAQDISHVEFLPIQIRNHKGRPVAETYFICHPIDPIPAIDIERSVIVWSEIDEDALDDVEKLVLDPERLDPTRKIFRVQGLTEAIFVQRAMADALDAEGFTGNAWIDVDAYTL